MYVFRKVADLQNHLNELRESDQSIAFAPTMGALHNGHMSLLSKCNQIAEITISSIFVNPTQFNDKSDLDKYPRTVEKDTTMLIEHGCDILFYPEVEEIYPNGTEPSTSYDFGPLDKVLEGVHRPEHFEGVAQVVNRLLEIVEPDWIVMGQKDYQQTAIIRKLLSLTNSNTKIIVSPTIREKDGLAMSSRNIRLKKEERKEAPTIYASLEAIRHAYKTLTVQEAKEQAIKSIEASGSMKIDYLELVHPHTLQPVTGWTDAESISVCTAVHLGEVRLIDNISIP